MTEAGSILLEQQLTDTWRARIRVLNPSISESDLDHLTECAVQSELNNRRSYLNG
jgi:hypothetical protein